ncbi:MAG: PKD domain-containing protein [Planctomycetes bacterium]|nr:PKD domain-containing protein [Planctomycetota bacterium]
MHRLLRIPLALGALAVMSSVASAQFSLRTLYGYDNYGNVGGAVYFDLNVTNTVRITQLDTNYLAPFGSPVGVQVYTTPGTYNGNEGNPAAWTQVGQDNGVATSQGPDVPTPLVLQAPFLLTPGSYGIALVAVGSEHAYTNGTGANQSFSDANLAIALGSATNFPFAAPAFTPRVWNGEIYYTLGQGLFANFTASTTSGPTPLNVTFTDTTFTSDPAGVTSWAWDLNGDSIVDSNAQAPSFTYTTCGFYNVSLTVTDATHPPSTITKTAYIQADPQLLVQASFVTSGTATPLQIQFTDTSSGSPTLWSWDLDGDNVPDSAQQNPTFTYAAGGSYNVTLTATNSCGANTTTQSIFVLANDECTGATPVVAGFNGPFSNVGATDNPLDPAWPCAGGGSDVWFAYTVAATGLLSIDLCGSSYDTALEAFSGTCGALSSIACNDDFCGLKSGLAPFSVTTGQLVLFRVGGFFAGQGSFVINISEIPPLANDECINAIPINLGSNGSFSNVGATDNPLDPAWPCASGGSDVWFSLTLACPLSIDINTCAGTNFDTALEVFTGTCGSLVSLACSDDSCGLQSSVSFTATPGVAYFIRVGGFFAGQGSFTLDVAATGNGAFFELQPGAGQASLVASGSPNLGASVTYQMVNQVGTAQLWFGVNQFAIPLCPGAGLPVIFTTLDILLPFGLSTFTSPVPCDPNLRGRAFYIQGLDWGGTGGCNPAYFGIGVSTTNTIATRVG